MTAGKFAEACPKFEASQQLDPGLGTMLNLAECYEKTGRTASAWAEYREAIPLARAAGSKARQDLATERAKALEERLSTLTIRAISGEDDSAHLEIRRDGVPVQPAELGSPIPVDPGEHVIATRSGSEPEQTTTVKIDRDATKLSIDVPIEAERNDKPVGESGGSGKTRKIAALSTAGAGLVIAGVGLYFGKRAFDQYDDSRAFCDDQNRCEPQGAKLIDDANSSALTSNILIGVGVGAIAVGAVLWLTAPKERKSAVIARPVIGRDGAMGTIELRF